MEKTFTAIGLAKEYLLNNPQCTFVFSVTVTAALFTVFAVLFRKGVVGKKNLKYFFIVTAALTAFQTACSVPRENDCVLPTAVAVTGCVFYAVLGLINAKKTEFTEKEYDGNKEEEDLPLFSEIKTPSVIPDAIKRFTERNGKLPENKENREKDIDFSHVKSVVDKLERFNLTAADKRALNSLKINVTAAESGEMNNRLKNEINDGLCSVLKMMSKYNV